MRIWYWYRGKFLRCWVGHIGRGEIVRREGRHRRQGKGIGRISQEPSLPRWKEPGIHTRDVVSEGFYDVYEGVLEM